MRKPHRIRDQVALDVDQPVQHPGQGDLLALAETVERAAEGMDPFQKDSALRVAGIYRERAKAQTVKVGDRFRDEDGYLMEVVHVEPSGDAWVRHPNQKRAGSILTRAAWFTRWTRVEGTR